MNSIYNDDSLTLHTDLYQINMMKTYWETGVYEKKAIFEAYFRKLPFENGYAIFAGLERIVRYIEQLRFSKTDIDYLRGLGSSSSVIVAGIELVNQLVEQSSAKDYVHHVESICPIGAQSSLQESN